MTRTKYLRKNRIAVDYDLFKQELKNKGLNISAICDRSSIYYIGVSRPTITKARNTGYFTTQTVEKLQTLLDVDQFILDQDDLIDSKDLGIDFDELESSAEQEVTSEIEAETNLEQIKRLSEENVRLKIQLKRYRVVFKQIGKLITIFNKEIINE